MKAFFAGWALLCVLALGGCASVSAVMQSDASLGDKFKSLGGLIASYLEGPSSNRSDTVKKYKYTGNGDLLSIENATLTPETAAPGQSVQALVAYAVLFPNPDLQATITESRALVGPTDTLMLSRRQVTREQGAHSSTIKFTLPADIAKSEYAIVTTISDGKQTKTARSTLRVM